MICDGRERLSTESEVPDAASSSPSASSETIGPGAEAEASQLARGSTPDTVPLPHHHFHAK